MKAAFRATGRRRSLPQAHVFRNQNWGSRCNAADAVFSPAVGAGTRVVVRKIFPSRAAGAVILADRSPLPLRKIRPPALPMLLAGARFFEPAVFSRLGSWHSWMALGKKFQAMVAFSLEKAARLRIQRSSVGTESGQVSDAINGPLYNESAMVKQQGAQTGKFFTAPSSAGTSMQAAGHDIAVPRMLRADG